MDGDGSLEAEGGGQAVGSRRCGWLVVMRWVAGEGKRARWGGDSMRSR